MINLANRSHHNKTKRHITNSETSSEPYTIMDEMNKMHDDNVLKLHEIKHTFETIDKIISEYTKVREDNKETISCQDCNRLINLATRSSHKTITILETLKHHQNQIQ